MLPSRQYIHTGAGLPIKDVGLEKRVGKAFSTVLFLF